MNLLVTIREMLETDIDKVLEIEEEAFTTPWSKEAFTMELTKNLLAKYIVAQVDEKIVAYGGIWLILDEGHVTNIAVLSEYRGKGIGEKIVKGLIRICTSREIRAITLEVRKSNEVAKNLYKKLGFIEFGIRPKYYLDNQEDAIVMWKTI